MKRRGFSIIDIVFAVLFVSILVLVGMKFMLSGEKQYQRSREATAFDLAASNLFEELYASPPRDGNYEKYVNHYGAEVASYDEAAYLLRYSVREDMELLKDIVLNIMDRDGTDIKKTMTTRYYIGGRE